LGVMCVFGTVAFESGCEDRITAEAEEFKELSEVDDVDQLDGDLNVEVTLIHGHCFDEWLHTAEDSPLLSHRWVPCSRGPPTA